MDNTDFNYFCGSCTKSIEYRRANCFTDYKIKHYKAGEYIAYKGKEATTLSMVIRGCVSTEIVLDTGVSYTTKHHNAPYPMGALALFAKSNHYRANFMALEDSTIISVNRNDVEDQMVKCRMFLRNFIAHNTTRFDVFANHIAVLTHKSLKSRVAFYIFSISKGGEFRFNKSLEDVANYLCVERPSLSRILRQLATDGVITYNRGEGRIIDNMALRDLLE